MSNRNRNVSVSAIGLDVHYKFSSVTMRDEEGRVVARERLEHRDRAALREHLARWPKGVTAVRSVEGSPLAQSTGSQLDLIGSDGSRRTVSDSADVLIVGWLP